MNDRKELTLSDTCTYYFIKLAGLCPFEIDRNRRIRFSRLGLIYNFSISIVYAYGFSTAVRLRHAIILWEETPLAVIIDIIGSILNYLAITTSWLVVACRQKTAIGVIESLREIESLRRRLGVIDSKCSLRNDWTTFKRQFLVFIIMIIIFVNMSLIHTTWCQDLQNQTLFWFLYNLPRGVFFIVPFNMIKIMISLQDQRRMLNRELLSVFRKDPPNRGVQRVSRKIVGGNPRLDYKNYYIFQIPWKMHAFNG